MIDQSESIYYFCYALICIFLGVAYLRSRSTEGTVITTKEFQLFQNGFVSGYACIILCELIASASFYHTFISIHLTLDQVTRLYVVTLFASTVTHVATEIVDVGTRKDKCILSAALYCISMFSIFFGGHYEMLLMGRILYGAASALQHTSFESYAVHQHASHGFPDDWLSQTFTLLTHIMALVAAVSGIVGQISASLGHLGAVAACCILFGLSAIYLSVVWEKDVNSPRFMLSGFMFNLTAAANNLRSNQQLLAFVGISSLCEASIVIFTFYWAPWLSTLSSVEQGNNLPYEIIFATFVCCSMLGNYLYQAIISAENIDGLLQAVMIGGSAAFFLGSVFQTPLLSYLVCLIVQASAGVYWPSIGFFRAKVVVPELRNIILIIIKICTLVISMITLSIIHHSPMLILMTCAALNGCAAYLQSNFLDSRSISLESSAEDDDEL